MIVLQACVNEIVSVCVPSAYAIDYFYDKFIIFSI